MTDNQNTESDAEKTLDNVLNDVAADVVPPSPVADIGGASSFSGRAGDDVPPISVSVPPEKGKRGRKPKPRDEHGNIIKDGEEVKPRPKLVGVTAGAGQTVNHDTAAIDPAAEVAVMLVNTSGMMLGGEAGAMKEQEALLAKQGFVAYFKAKGVNNVPPWVILAGALSPYYLRVITTTPAKPKISSFFGKLGAYIKGFFKGRKNARSYSGDDIKRENDTSEKTS